MIYQWLVTTLSYLVSEKKNKAQRLVFISQDQKGGKPRFLDLQGRSDKQTSGYNK